jgi:aspartate/methionine/tyrosine aminotransferase
MQVHQPHPARRGAAGVRPPVAGNGRWRLDLDSLAGAASSKTRAALLMSPSMPSGHVFTDDEWAAVAVACERADCWLLYDATMDEILFDGISTGIPHQSTS